VSHATNRTPFLLSLIAAAAGLVGLASAITPEWPGRLAFIEDLLSPTGPSVADGLSVSVSLAILLLARGIARRRHRSYQAAVVLLAVGAVLHVLKGLDVEEALLYLATLALLWRNRRLFDAKGDPGGPPRAVLRALVLLSGLVLYGLGAVYLHALLRTRENLPQLPSVLKQIAYGLVGQDVYSPAGRFNHGLTLSLAAAFLGCAAYVLWIALRPRDPAVVQSDEERAEARALVERDGCDSLAYFALRRDKAYFFDARRRAFLAYRAAGGVALVSGDPVGDPAAFDELIESFAAFCHGHAWRIGVLGVGAEHRGAWARVGLRSLYVGDEAIVRPEAFSLEGRPIRKVRQSVSRLHKAGYTAEVVRAGDLDEARWLEIERVTQAWLRGEPERGFSMALDDTMRDPEHAQTVFTLALDAEGRVQGFLHFVPVPAANGLSLSAMRRLLDTPNGLMEFLLCETFAWGRSNGIRRVSLNFNAFGELLRAEHGLCRWQRLVRYALGKADRYFQVERLLDFNRKFFPEWEPRYAAFERWSDVPLGALVTLHHEGLVEWPAPLRRLWPSAA
jgi:lysyl-tRNA synthetase class 2